MTRTVEEVETDFAATQAAWADAREAHRVALLKAGDLRRRAVNDDSTVSAADLAAADHEAQFSELKIEARKTATEALEVELHSAKAEAFANEFLSAEQPLRQEYEQSLAELESALGRVAATWRAHATLINASWQMAAYQGHHTASPRIRFSQYRGFAIDTVALKALDVFAPVETLVQKAMNSLSVRL